MNGFASFIRMAYFPPSYEKVMDDHANRYRDRIHPSYLADRHLRPLPVQETFKLSSGNNQKGYQRPTPALLYASK